MLNNKSWSNRFETLSVGFSAKQKITGRGSLALKHKKRSSRLDELARTYRYERIASGALASGQLEYLSCVWQDLSSSRPLCAPFSLSRSLPPLPFSSSARPLLFHRLSHSGHARHSITLFHRPRYSSRHSTRLGTYVWLREMLLCISSRMFDGALLFKHGPRHYRWTDHVFGSAYVRG